MTYVNLHGHSHYSLLDGYGSPKQIVERAKALGYPGVALTDHGVTYGLIELYQAAKSAGIKPILGCELYVAPRTRFDKEAKVDIKPYHLTAIAETNEGYENLLEMVTKAHVEGFYYKPRVDMELLEKRSAGLIVLSGCLAAQLPRAILSENEEEVHRIINEFIRIFGKDNYFLEMQDHPLMEQQSIVNERVKKLAKEYGLGLVVTCDSHYPKPEDSDAHDLLLCIQTGATVSDEGRMHYAGDYSLRDPNELKNVFADCPEALANTVKIAERCSVEFDFSKNLIPSFETPGGMAPDDYLRQLCTSGLTMRFDGEKVPDDYMERLEYELDTVHKMGFDTYFLIVHDFVKYAREQGIVVGPGRGSAAGSILAWSLKITDLDPIKYGLFFERFLNPERVSMPDIDIDFADNRRDEVLDYVIKKYGRDNVAQIITFGTMAPRAAVRDVGRALGYPYAEVDQLAKIVPPPVLGKHIPLKVSIEDDPSLKEAYTKNERARLLLDYAKQLEGTVRHAGTHACAVVISEEPLTKYTACQYGARGDEVITQYSMKPLEDLGLLKMDFLGLKNLTVIEQTEHLVKAVRGETVDVTSVPLDDKKTFQLLQKADTTGVFQLESGGMRRYLKQLKPTEFDDIVAMGALYRPGPMEWIPNYIKGKHNPKSVKYLHPSFKDILEKTHGVAVYQEQILQLARDFAGFTVGEADLLRKAVGKKIPSLLAEQQVQFVEGAVKNGYEKVFAKEVFEKVVEPFAGYGFNKAHAVCYGLIAYQTAYLKAHFPVEFMTALLCSDANNTDRVVLEIKECIEMGIDVLPPSVNESFSNFTVVDEKKIRFGLLAIKGVGEGPINALISARKSGGPFTSLEDFAKRVPLEVLNKKVIQALAYSGAMDELGDRSQLAENYDEIVKFAKYFQGLANTGQGDLFGSLDDDSGFSLEMRDVPKSTNMQRLKWEKDFLGMYVSGHPLRGLRAYISRKGQLIADLDKKKVGRNIGVLGTLSGMRKILTKNGGYMATFFLEDPSAKISAVMFPKSYLNFGSSLSEDSVFTFSGKLDFRQGQFQMICDSAKILSVDAMIENAKSAGLFNPDDKSDIGIRLIDDILADHEDGADVQIEPVDAEHHDAVPEDTA
ncbi:DNA polymerase III subunit alpha, partial [Candidatus Peregrinibacteria bacterium]|nr:DNA polymerase III subunit alpha [Candidatus Peregrinibacteria bacterium]